PHIQENGNHPEKELVVLQQPESEGYAEGAYLDRRRGPLAIQPKHHRKRGQNGGNDEEWGLELMRINNPLSVARQRGRGCGMRIRAKDNPRATRGCRGRSERFERLGRGQSAM